MNKNFFACALAGINLGAKLAARVKNNSTPRKVIGTAVLITAAAILLSCDTNSTVDNTLPNQQDARNRLNALVAGVKDEVGDDLFASIQAKIDEIVSKVGHDTNVAATVETNKPTLDGLVQNARKNVTNKGEVRTGLSNLTFVTKFKEQLEAAASSLIGDFFAPITASIESIVGNVTHETDVDEFVTANTQAVEDIVDAQFDLAKKNLIANATEWAKDKNTEYSYRFEGETDRYYGGEENERTKRAVDKALASLTLDSDVHAVVLAEFIAEYPISIGADRHAITPTFSEYMAAQKVAQTE